MRTDGRQYNQIRSLKIIPEVNKYAEGSVRIELGQTHLLCTASVEEGVPKWMSGTGQGWISAEYGMLPRSTHTRIRRDKAANSGRTQEISRLIGRSLRAAVDLQKLGERQIYVDCDVIQADGGTRTAAITGGFVALALAAKFLKEQNLVKEWPIKSYIAAISLGVKSDQTLLDLNYDEDSSIDTDMNIVLNSHMHLIEIQGTAEKDSLPRKQLNEALDLAELGCRELFAEQQKWLGDVFPLEI